MIQVKTSFDKAAMRRFITSVRAKPGQVAKARFRALSKLMRYVESQAARSLAKFNDLPVKTLRGGGGKKNRARVQIKKVLPSHDAGHLWIGTNPIAPTYAGKLRQLKRGKGVKVRSHSFPGAFINRMSSGHEMVRARIGAHRYPVEERKIRLNDAAVVAEIVQRKAPHELRKLFARELNYEVNVRGRA